MCVLVYHALNKPVDRPTPVNPYPFTSALINSCAGLWRQYVEHPFVTQIFAGTLPKENFVHYLKYVSEPRLISDCMHANYHQARLHLSASLCACTWVRT
jgi:hypothetical protein